MDIVKGTDGSMMEALLKRVLKPNAGLLAELKTLGVDPERIEVAYPTTSWVKVLEAVRRHHYALHVSDDTAYRHIGRDFTDGFLSTVAGRVVAIAMTFLSVKKLVERSPTYMGMGRKDMKVTTQLTSETTGLVRFNDFYRVNENFPFGIYQRALERMKKQATLSLEKRAPGDFDIVIKWT